MYKIFRNFWPFFFIALVWFIFSSPYFLQHKVPYPAKDQVSSFTPWNQYAEYAGPVQNNAIPDVINQIYPWKYFTIQSLKQGNIPVWNPYSFSGNPHLANYQTAVFSPFNLLFFILPFIDAWSLLVLLQPLIAGIFTYLFLRELKIGHFGSLIGSVTFMFCGFMTVWMPYGTLAMSAAFLPIILFAIRKSSQKFFSPVLILLSSGLVFSFFSGHFQTSLYVALYSFMFLLFNFFITKNNKTFLWSLAFFTVGIIFSLIQILPSVEFYKQSVRSEIFSNTGAITLQYLVTIFSPDFFGNPVTRNNWYGNYVEWASFMGIIPLTLAVIAIQFRKNKDILFFLFSGIVSLLLALDTPLQNLLIYLKIPIFSTSIPSRIIVLFSFSFAVLAGFGFEKLQRLVEKKERKKILIPLCIMGAVLISIWIAVSGFNIIPHEKKNLAQRNFILPSFIFLVGSGLIWINILKRKKLFLLTLAWGLLILTTFDALRFANKWMPFDSSELIFPDVKVITAMQKNKGNGRVYGDFKAYIDTYYQIPSIEGYDPLYSRRYGELLASSKTGKYSSAQKSQVYLDRKGKYVDRILDLLAVETIYHPKSYTNQPWAYPVWEKSKNYSVIYEDDKFQLYRNNRALPRVKIFTKYEVIKNDHKIIERFYSKDFDFRNILILEEDPLVPMSDEVGISKVKIILNEPSRIKIAVSADRTSLLFLSDSYYPAWEASVNGKIAKIYRADYALRAVVVPKGNSSVEFFIRGLL